MLVTPSTVRSNGGSSTPSLRKYGSTQPPPAAAAAAAISVTGSTTPCA